jgi:hypothetical protein
MSDTTGSSWDLVNYVGELFTASQTKYPIVTLVGQNGAMSVQNDEFPLSVEYALPAAGQNVRSEDDSVTAPSPVDVTTTQNKNCIQIQQHSVKVTYKALSNMNRLTGIADANKPLSINDHLNFQKTQKINVIKQDMEYTWINGTYVASASSDVAQSSRGVFEGISDASNGVAAGGADLSKELINQMLREAYADGAIFQNPVFVVNAFQKQQISKIYEYVPTDRFLGGSNIQAVETDMGRIGVVLNSFMDTDDLLLLELSVCSNVFQPVPGKGPLFYEPLAKAGAAESGQLYTQFGPDYGPAWMHNGITGLSTS